LQGAVELVREYQDGYQAILDGAPPGIIFLISKVVIVE
jgi:hypothetical protein